VPFVGGREVELTEPVKALLREAARALTVAELGPGGQRRAERALGWSRVTVRQGQRELVSGFSCVDGFALRGRKRAEAHLPDPTFRTTRLYTRLTAAEVRRQLIAQKGYSDAALPCVQTIGAKLNALGYHPQTVAKAAPQKRSPRPTPSSLR